MNFKVELDNIDYADSSLIVALDNISNNVMYKITMSNEEMENAIEQYLIEKLNINLESSDMRLDLKEERLYYSNVFEASVIIDEIIKHFGNGSVSSGGSGETQDYYTIQSLLHIRKIAKFSVIRKYSNEYELYFDQANEFTSTWIYKYIKSLKED